MFLYFLSRNNTGSLAFKKEKDYPEENENQAEQVRKHEETKAEDILFYYI